MQAADAAVQRHVRAPLAWALLLAVLLTPLFVIDVRDALEPLVPPDRAVRVTGTAGDPGRTDLPVSYVHPLTEQKVDVEVVIWHDRLRPSRPGPVPLVVDRDDPDSVWLAGDRFPAEQNLLAYGWWPLLPLVLWAMRRWRAGSVRRLEQADLPSYAVLAAVTPPRYSAGRCLLHLYEVDAPPGADPLCTVPLVSTAGVALAGPALPAEVKGVPRAGGLVVTCVAGLVLRPSARALSRGGRPRPDHIEPLDLPAHVPSSTPPPGPLPSGRPWWALAGWRVPLIAASLLLLAAVGVLTWQGSRQAATLDRDGDPVLARVVTADPALFELEVTYRDRSGRQRKAIAPADYPEEFTVGRLYPAVAAPDGGGSGLVRLLAEPYDAVEPVVWGSLPLLLTLALSARWLRDRRRIDTVARLGPWLPVEAWRLRYDAVALLRPGTHQVACEVPVEPLQLNAMTNVGVIVLLEQAGFAAPGEAVALRHGRQPLSVLGTACAGS